LCFGVGYKTVGEAELPPLDPRTIVSFNFKYTREKDRTQSEMVNNLNLKAVSYTL